jgi:hypothetical protein
MSSVEERLEVMIAGGCEMYSAMGLGFGKGSVCEKVTVASKSRCLFCTSVRAVEKGFPVAHIFPHVLLRFAVLYVVFEGNVVNVGGEADVPVSQDP